MGRALSSPGSFLFYLLFLTSLTPTDPAWGAEDTASCGDYKKTWVKTTHEAVIGGKSLAYTATTGYLQISLTESSNVADPNNASRPTDVAKGCIFFTYYQLNAAPLSRRPLTFAFNGGPGSSSEWLHMGLVSPSHPDMGPAGLTPQLPFQLVPNSDSPLDLSDFVMIDPMSTGFSHPERGSNEKQFFNAKNDANSVATFIRDFLDVANRRTSPVYVMGESYGGMRGPLVTKYLFENFSIPVNGLILVSPALSWSTFDYGSEDNDLPYFTALPTYVLAAAFHGKSKQFKATDDALKVFAEAEKFAFGKYRHALNQGSALEEKKFHEIAAQIAQLTGLPQDRVEEKNLRIPFWEFAADLLKDTRQVIGTYDDRFVGPRLSTQSGENAPDPENYFTSAYTAAVNSYLRNDLGFVNANQPYLDLNYGGNRQWGYDSDGHNFSVVHTLSEDLASNPNLQVFVASGYYDLVVPMASVDFERTRLDPALNLDRMAIHRYPGGHMLYLNPVALHQLKADLSRYYELSPAVQATLK